MTEPNFPQTNFQRLDFLDTMRGAAVIIVFLFHALGTAFPYSELPWGQWFRQWNVDLAFLSLLPISFGWTGVAIFFVISGFCIHLSFAKTIARLPANNSSLNTSFLNASLESNPVKHHPRISYSLIIQAVKQFYWRRFWRIYPPYGAALLLFALIFPLTRLSWYTSQDVWEFISHVFLFHNFDADLFLKINPSFWSIAVEMQLYLLYPLLWMGSRRWGWGKMLTWLSIIEVTCRLFDGLHLSIWDSRLSLLISCSPWIHFLSWGIGAYLAELFWQQRLNSATFPLLRTRSIWWLGAAVICYGIKPLSAFTFLLCALATATMIAHQLEPQSDQLNSHRSHHNGLFSHSLFKRFFNQSQLLNRLNQHLVKSGIFSYSIYLLHQPILLSVAQLLKLLPSNWMHPWLLFIGCCLSWQLVILISQKFYDLVEIPSIAWGKKLVRFH
ncbi:MAG: acyltransferase [Pseudanabaena sp. ELA607]|jgi:peptidoglycan/LPS O-acetylase OafA/YrhL